MGLIALTAFIYGIIIFVVIYIIKDWTRPGK